MATMFRKLLLCFLLMNRFNGDIIVTRNFNGDRFDGDSDCASYDAIDDGSFCVCREDDQFGTLYDQDNTLNCEYGTSTFYDDCTIRLDSSEDVITYIKKPVSTIDIGNFTLEEDTNLLSVQLTVTKWKDGKWIEKEKHDLRVTQKSDNRKVLINWSSQSVNIPWESEYAGYIMKISFKLREGLDNRNKFDDCTVLKFEGQQTYRSFKTTFAPTTTEANKSTKAIITTSGKTTTKVITTAKNSTVAPTTESTKSTPVGSKDSEEDNDTILIIIITCIAAFVIIVLIVVFICCYWKYKIRKSKESENADKEKNKNNKPSFEERYNSRHEMKPISPQNENLHHNTSNADYLAPIDDSQSTVIYNSIPRDTSPTLIQESNYDTLRNSSVAPQMIINDTVYDFPDDAEGNKTKLQKTNKQKIQKKNSAFYDTPEENNNTQYNVNQSNSQLDVKKKVNFEDKLRTSLQAGNVVSEKNSIIYDEPEKNNDLNINDNKTKKKSKVSLEFGKPNDRALDDDTEKRTAVNYNTNKERKNSENSKPFKSIMKGNSFNSNKAFTVNDASFEISDGLVRQTSIKETAKPRVMIDEPSLEKNYKNNERNEDQSHTIDRDENLGINNPNYQYQRSNTNSNIQHVSNKDRKKKVKKLQQELNNETFLNYDERKDRINAAQRSEEIESRKHLEVSKQDSATKPYLDLTGDYFDGPYTDLTY